MRKSFAARVAAALMFSAGLAHAELHDGEVVKVDRAQGRVSLRHGELPKLDFPAMTMAYRVRDLTMLERVSAGDRVRFDAEKVDGYYTITVLNRVR